MGHHLFHHYPDPSPGVQVADQEPFRVTDPETFRFLCGDLDVLPHEKWSFLQGGTPKR